ncbi:MAG: carboxymuconolactone decarboxylase family protein [Nitriliruptorales bacterium]
MRHHRRGLRRLLKDDELLARVEDDFETAGLDDRRLAILRFSRLLTERPARTSAADVDRLREVGFDDRDILHIVEVVAYYAYANRIADGLGIELEPWIPDDD